MQDQKFDGGRKEESRSRTPGASGHPEPGSGHDDSKTTTVADGPPRKLVDGQPGAFGDSPSESFEGATAAEHLGKTER